jgi:DNA-binding NarL/FixJ family response regulator
MIVFHVHVVVVLLDRMVSGRGYARCGIPSVAQRLMHVCRKSCNRRSSIAAFSIARSNAVRMLFTGRPLRTRDRKLVARGRLKADPSTRNIPVIVTTAFSYGSLVDRAITAGADEIMHKPFALKLLRAAMQRHLSLDDQPPGIPMTPRDLQR